LFPGVSLTTLLYFFISFAFLVDVFVLLLVPFLYNLLYLIQKAGWNSSKS